MTYFSEDGKPVGRELTILEYLDKFPNYNHNALMKEVVIKKLMAKKTFEKTIKSLISKGIVRASKSKNKIIYIRTDNFEEKYNSLLEKQTEIMYKFLIHEIKKITDNYKTYSVEDKVFNITFHLRNILQTDTGFTILDSLKNPDETLYADEHLTNQQLISSLLSIVAKDIDFKTVYPLVMNSLGIFPPLDYNEINKNQNS